MSYVQGSAKRLFWMIVLSLFFPWLAMALEFGWSRQLAVSVGSTVAIPVGLMLLNHPVSVIFGQFVGLIGNFYGIYQLCVRRYEPVSQDNETPLETESPPEYTSPEEPLQTAGKQ